MKRALAALTCACLSCAGLTVTPGPARATPTGTFRLDCVTTQSMTFDFDEGRWHQGGAFEPPVVAEVDTAGHMARFNGQPYAWRAEVRERSLLLIAMTDPAVQSGGDASFAYYGDDEAGPMTLHMSSPGLDGGGPSLIAVAGTCRVVRPGG